MPAPSTTPCNLQPTPLDPTCDFKGSPGSVTLTVEDRVGTVLFATATYDGQHIVPTPAKTITFTLVAGLKDLDVVYGFSDPAGGIGVLKEVCSGSTALIGVRANNPAVSYHICA